MSQGPWYNQGPFINLYGPKTNSAQGLSFSQQAAQQYAAAQQNASQGLSLSQLAAQAHNQFGHAYNAYAQQGVTYQMAAQYAQAYKPKQFKINGIEMDLDEFLNAIYPDDCAEKTYLALKLTKGNQDDTSSK